MKKSPLLRKLLLKEYLDFRLLKAWFSGVLFGMSVKKTKPDQVKTSIEELSKELKRFIKQIRSTGK